MKIAWTCAIVLFSLLLLTGCVQTRILEDGHAPYSQKYVSVQRFAARIQGREGQVQFHDQREMEGRILLLTKDSLQILPRDSVTTTVMIAMADVEHLQYRQPWLGGVEGFAIGTVGGALLFGGIGWAMESGGHSEMKGLATGILAMGGGVLGAITGIIVGANVGGVHRAILVRPAFDSAATSNRSRAIDIDSITNDASVRKDE